MSEKFFEKSQLREDLNNIMRDCSKEAHKKKMYFANQNVKFAQEKNVFQFILFEEKRCGV